MSWSNALSLPYIQTILIILAQTSNEPGVPTLDIEFERFQYPITYPDASRVKYQCEEIARSTPSQVTIDFPVFYYFSVSHLGRRYIENPSENWAYKDEFFMFHWCE